ncbi:MAG: hypothetical protein Q8M69_05025, partial [Reyranella sp.]|nr:hypothetical protein [Reyranella sp.]
MPTSVEEAKHNTVAACANENAGGNPPAFRSTVRTAYCQNGLLIVVEAALARFVVALAARLVRSAAAETTGRLAEIAAFGRRSRRSAGEIGTAIPHRTTIATGGCATVTTAALTTAATIAAATGTAGTATTVAAATAAAITTAAAAFTAAATTVAATTAATTVAASAATTIRLARAARSEAAAIAAATTTAA